MPPSISVKWRWTYAVDLARRPQPRSSPVAGGDCLAFISACPNPSAAAPLTAGPFLAARTASGWRIDWMTPGGGVQTTFLIAPPETMS